MANILAAQNGNWSATSTWAGGVVPTGSDNAYANGYTVTVNVNAAATKVSTVGENGAAAGGGFTLSNGVTLTAHCEAGSTPAVSFGAAGSANIVGALSGGSAQYAFGAVNSSAGTLTVTGNASGGSGQYATGVWNSGTGTLVVAGRAIANAWGPGSALSYANVGAQNDNRDGMMRIGGIELGDNGYPPVSGICFLEPSVGNVAVFTKTDRTKKTLIDDSGLNLDYPDVSDVRLNTVFATSLIGTCAVPAPNHVDLGVPVDDTVGTAVLTESAMQSALAAALQDVFGSSVTPDFDALITATSDLVDRINASVPEGPMFVAPAPASATEMIVWTRCFDEHGEIEPGVPIDVQLVSAPAGTSHAYDSAISSAISDEDGIAYVSIPRGTDFVFKARRGGGRWVRFDGADLESIELPNLIG